MTANLTPLGNDIGNYRGNCALVALKTVSCLPDADIIRVAHKYGFRSGKGMFTSNITRAARDLGLDPQDLPMADIINNKAKTGYCVVNNTFGFRGYTTRRRTGSVWYTVAQFVKKHPRGVYIIHQRGHTLTLRHGKLIDPNFSRGCKVRRRVYGATKINNPHVGDRSCAPSTSTAP